MSVVTDKMHAYNDRLIYNALKGRGLPDELAADFTFSGCCNCETHYHTIRNEWYFPTPEWLCEVLGVIGEGPAPAYKSVHEIVQALKNAARRHMEDQLDTEVVNASTWRMLDQRGHTFDAMFVGKCAERCRYPLDGGVDFYLIDAYFTGAATVIDSLSAIDRLVFREKRYTLEEFVQILKDNYNGQPLLQAEIKNKFPKFGNDDEEGDRYAALAMNAVLDAMEEIDWPQGYVPVGGFYSLHHHNNFGWELCATPDGRMAGEPYSENQSPVYGTDRKGVTALLSSLAKLPFHRTPCGGVNLTFSSPVTPALLASIIESYFKMGGLHIAITVADRATLEAALANPQAYRTLTVRLFGFSEYFIHLSEWQQKEFLARTALN
jgi:formate C-acetyltransferase